MLIATEATAAGLILEYWTKAVPIGVWIALVLAGVYSSYLWCVSYFGASLLTDINLELCYSSTLLLSPFSEKLNFGWRPLRSLQLLD